MPDCLFCRIVRGEVQSQIIQETEHCLAFYDIRPVAPTHVLVIPKKHLNSIQDIGPEDKDVLFDMVQLANEVATLKYVSESGYRIVTNVGLDAGQSVFHLHMHVLGGRFLNWPPG